MKNKHTKTNNCEYCGKPINGLPFKCKFCGEHFCYDDRLPEDHECIGLAKFKEKVQNGEDGVFSGFAAKSPTRNYTSSSKYNPEKGRPYNPRAVANKKLIKQIFIDKVGLIRSIIISIILTTIISLSWEIKIDYPTSPMIFGTFGFLVDFILVLVISVVFNWRNKWGAFIGAILISLFLGACFIPIVNSVLTFIAVLLPIFAISYLSFISGNVIRHRHYNTAELYTAHALRIVFTIMFILIVAGVVTNNSTLNRINSDLSSFGAYLSSSSQAPTEPINSSWVTQFFSGVNTYRSTNLQYCPELSTFAQARYKTMSSNIQISHYGYSQTFDSFWPNGYSYGGYIYSGFGEEVLYPNKPGSSTTTCVDVIFCSTSSNAIENYTPSGYIVDLISSAPIHWKGLLSTDYSYYGYYVKNGPGYSILGPNNGQVSCQTTEIPGPNINVTQYFAQYGCTTQLTTDTWFVIELAPLCPTA